MRGGMVCTNDSAFRNLLRFAGLFKPVCGHKHPSPTLPCEQGRE